MFDTEDISFISPRMAEGEGAWGALVATTSFSWPGEAGFNPGNVMNINIRTHLNSAVQPSWSSWELFMGIFTPLRERNDCS